VRKIVAEHEGQLTSFESSFNQSLISLREQDFSGAIFQLLKSFEVANAEGASQKDLVRYKVQELHLLDSLKKAFNLVEYEPSPGFIL
jgi:hypothetical protein